MRALTRSWLSRLCTALWLLTAALISAAHGRPPAPDEAALAAFALPDGTLPELCAAGHGDGGAPDAARHCLDCLLAAASGLAPSLAAFGRVRASLARAERTAGEVAPSRLVWEPQRARAPPLVLSFA